MADGFVIVGAGEAGARAASALREQGFEGPVTLVGDEAHGPYERPPLSKAVMTAAETPPTPTFILDEAKLAARSISHLAGVRAAAVDRLAHHVILNDGRALPYAKLLIATGAGPRRLSTSGAADNNVCYLRTFADALGLRARLRRGSRLVVIGGGFIGLEIAASARARGCEVTLVEMAARVLMRGVPAAVAERVAQRHRDAGVILRTGVGIERIWQDGEGSHVILAGGEHLRCDAIVAGIGAMPETRLAQASGLAIENGIRVDARLRTDDPDIYAAGDCCSFPHPLYGDRRVRLEAWRNAQDQGNAVAGNMLGGETAFDAVPWFWSDQYQDTLQVAGLSDPAATVVERKLDGCTLYFELDEDGRLTSASGLGPNGMLARDIRLAEMLIARREKPDPAALASSSVKLKSLLR